MRDGQRFIQCKKKKNTVVFASRRVTAFFYWIIPFSFFNPTSVVLRTAFGLFPRQKHLVFPFTCTSPGLVRQELSISILPEREGACQLLSQKQTIREGTFKSGVVRALILLQRSACQVPSPLDQCRAQGFVHEYHGDVDPQIRNLYHVTLDWIWGHKAMICAYTYKMAAVRFLGCQSLARTKTSSRTHSDCSNT